MTLCSWYQNGSGAFAARAEGIRVSVEEARA